MYRRLISLICSGWVPDELVSSRSCLFLLAGVSAVRPIPKVHSRVLLTVPAPLVMHWKAYLFVLFFEIYPLLFSNVLKTFVLFAAFQTRYQGSPSFFMEREWAKV